MKAQRNPWPNVYKQITETSRRIEQKKATGVHVAYLFSGQINKSLYKHLIIWWFALVVNQMSFAIRNKTYSFLPILISKEFKLLLYL